MSEKNKKQKEKKGGFSKIIIIILILVIILLGAFAAAYMLFFNKSSNKSANKTSISSSSSNNNNNNATSDSTNEATLSLDETIINLADTDSERYVKVQVSFGYDSSNSKLTSEVTSTDVNKKPIFADAVIKILRTKKSTDLTGKSLDDIKQEILNAVNPYLKNGQFSSVYFDELVVQ
jgi:flagellar FliL protein